MKICNTCHQELDLSMFGVDKRVKSGINSRCKQCANKKQKESRAKNPEMHRAIEVRSRINNRDTFLAGKVGYYNRIKLDPEWQKKQKVLRGKNKEIKRDYDRQYQIDNREKLSAVSSQWNKNNPELRLQIIKSYKARRRAWLCFKSDKTRDVLKWELSQEKVCHWCECDCSENYHIDHYIPLSKGGRHAVNNLVIACPTCNMRKSAKMPEQFLSEIHEPDITL